MAAAWDSLKVGVIIPSRGDRPLFLQNALRQLAAQTLQPVEMAVMDYAPESFNTDITQRYRKGYDRLRGKGLDIIALLEDDDYYHPDYLAYMVNEWVARGKPDLLGTSFTWYYHIRHFAYLQMQHHSQSHAMSTLIRPDLDFPWCPDNEAFTDVWLWNLHSHLRGIIFTPDRILCLGIKHDVGLTGGNSHTHHRFTTGRGKQDPDKAFLRSNTTPESFDFLANYFDSKL